MPQGTDGPVVVEGLAWINCDGKENFPDGEVFTGRSRTPRKAQAKFSFPAVHGGREVHHAS